MFLGSRANGGGRPQRRGLGTGSRGAVETRKCRGWAEGWERTRDSKTGTRQGENEEGMGSGARGGKGGRRGEKEPSGN